MGPISCRCDCQDQRRRSDGQLRPVRTPAATPPREAFPQAQVYADYRELLARADIEVVDIVVPSYLHHEIASAALAAGKHLLLEKPMALSLRECDDLIALARKHNRIFAVGHELRLSSLWGKAKELIASGFIGEPKYALIELSRRPYRLGSENWRYDISRVGSWILEEPIHFFDLARWYLSVAWRSANCLRHGQFAASRSTKS